jgi:hypothetical protein
MNKPMNSSKSVNWISIDEAENIPNNIAEELFTKELLITAYTSSVEANNRRWEYLTLPLDERYKIMQNYIKENLHHE